MGSSPGISLATNSSLDNIQAAGDKMSGTKASNWKLSSLFKAGVNVQQNVEAIKIAFSGSGTLTSVQIAYKKGAPSTRHIKMKFIGRMIMVLFPDIGNARISQLFHWKRLRKKIFLVKGPFQGRESVFLQIKLVLIVQTVLHRRFRATGGQDGQTKCLRNSPFLQFF